MSATPWFKDNNKKINDNASSETMILNQEQMFILGRILRFQGKSGIIGRFKLLEYWFFYSLQFYDESFKSRSKEWQCEIWWKQYIIKKPLI